MGREIVYCSRCGHKIHPSEFEKGRAGWTDNQAVCAKCAPEAGVRLTPSTRKNETRKSTALRLTPVPPVPEEPEEEEASPPARSGLGWILGGGGVALAAIAVAVVLLMTRSGNESVAPPLAQPTSAAAPDPAIPKPQTFPLSPREREAKESLEEARRYLKDHPEDLQGSIGRFQDVVFRWDRSDAGAEARREMEELQAKLSALVASGMTDLEARLKPALDEERYGMALKLLAQARKDHDAPAWTLRIDKRSREIEDAAAKAYEKLEVETMEAKARGAADAVKALRDRVVRWELKDYTARIEEIAGPAAPTVTAAVPDAPLPARPKSPVDLPPKTAEGKEYRARWERAMRRATGRDFAGAARELAEGSEAPREEDVRREAAADLEDARKLADLWRAAREAWARAPKGSTLSLDVRDERGSLKKVAGRVFEVDSERAELRVDGEKETVFVEFDDLAAPSLRALLPAADARLAALGCLLEGEIDEAARLLGAAPEAAAPKYWMFAREARARAPRPDPDAAQRERSARALFYAAQREYRSKETRAQAILKYRTLQGDFVSVPFVLRALPQIQKRSLSGREYFLAAVDLRARGTFRLDPHPLAEKAWVSKSDSDISATLRNHVEIEFVAVPDVGYRAWAYLGGCCTETFGFFYQATEYALPNPEKPRETVRAEPDTTFAVPLKHGIRFLKPSHAAHSPKKEPKAAARWEWVELPLPKYSAPGLKKIRLNTDQQGFGVACVVVSSTRKAAPAEPELKELFKARAADPPTVSDPSLLGHWTFSEAGDRVDDASGNGNAGALTGGAGRAEGGLSFDGKSAVATVADTEALRLAGDLTIAFWMKKTGEPDEWARIVGKGDTKVRNYGIWEEPGNGKRLLFQQYNLNGDVVLNFYTTRSLEVGTWCHVAIVVEGTKGSFYVNGELDASDVRTGAPGTSNQPLLFGHSWIHSGYQGLLDEVRIYSRALPQAEVQSLVSLGR